MRIMGSADDAAQRLAARSVSARSHVSMTSRDPSRAKPSPNGSARAEPGLAVAWPEDGTDAPSRLLHLLHPRKAPASPGVGPWPPDPLISPRAVEGSSQERGGSPIPGGHAPHLRPPSDILSSGNNSAVPAWRTASVTSLHASSAFVSSHGSAFGGAGTAGGGCADDGCGDALAGLVALARQRRRVSSMSARSLQLDWSQRECKRSTVRRSSISPPPRPEGFSNTRSLGGGSSPGPTACSGIQLGGTHPRVSGSGLSVLHPTPDPLMPAADPTAVETLTVGRPSHGMLAARQQQHLAPSPVPGPGIAGVVASAAAARGPAVAAGCRNGSRLLSPREGPVSPLADMSESLSGDEHAEGPLGQGRQGPRTAGPSSHTAADGDVVGALSPGRGLPGPCSKTWQHIEVHPSRHPPALRVAIGLLPSALQLPSATSATAISPTTAVHLLMSGPSPAVALAQLLGPGRLGSPDEPLLASSASAPSPAKSSSAAAASSAPSGPIHVPSSLPSARSLPLRSQQPQSTQTHPPPGLTGLPSFLGAPVVLDPPPPHLLGGGPGTPSPGLRPSLSRPPSATERSPLSASSSLAALHTGSLPAAAGAGQTWDCASLSPTSSGIPRSIRGATVSRRSMNGRTSFHRNGSYFRVREAVPEAVLDTLPSVQAARGFPPQPQHPGAVPDEWPPKQPLRHSLTATTSGQQGQQGGGLATASTTVGGICNGQRRYGMDLALVLHTTGSLMGAAHKYGGGGNGNVLSANSSPNSTASSGGGYSQSGGLSGHASWLRRAEAVPPPDLLPIQPSAPPLGMDHLQPASVLTEAIPRPAAAAASAAVASRTTITSGGGFKSPQPWAFIGLVTSDDGCADMLAEVPAAAAMAAAAVASYSAQLDEAALELRETFLAETQRIPCPQPDSGIPSSVAGDSSVPSPSGRLAAQPPPPPQQRLTFRAQSKIRLMNLGALGFGASSCSGASDDLGSSSAAASEHEALLALLGSSRMKSSVLTATCNPGGGTTDPAVHGVRDPRYDPRSRICIVPDHVIAAEGVPGGGASSDGSGAAAAGCASVALMGDSRIGSTVFSPPAPGLGKLAMALSFRRRQHARAGWTTRSGSGGGAAPLEASRSAMPDLQLLSRRTGSTSVVGPDGRTVHLLKPGPGAGGLAQLEEPPPEELVSAVYGHVCHQPWRPGSSSAAGMATRASRREITSLPNCAIGFPNEYMLETVRDDESGCGVSDGEDERLTGERLRGGDGGACCVKVRTAQATDGSVSGPVRASGSGLSSGGGGFRRLSANGGGANSGVVPSLIRHLSAPARRLTLTSNNGLAAAAAQPTSPAAAPAADGRHGTLVHKPSLIAAGLRFLKRALTPHGNNGADRSWSVRNGGAADDGRCSPAERAKQPPPRPCMELSPGLNGGGGAMPSHSRRKLQASQRSFVKHSAVLGWVQPTSMDEDAASTSTTRMTDPEADYEAGSPAGLTSRNLTSGGGTRLQSIQSLMAGASGALTCDAVVAFSPAEGGGGSGGDGDDADGAAAFAMARRHRAGRAGHSSYIRRGGLAHDDSSEDAFAGRSSRGPDGFCTGGSVTGGGGDGIGWVYPSPPQSRDASAGTLGGRWPPPSVASTASVSKMDQRPGLPVSSPHGHKASASGGIGGSTAPLPPPLSPSSTATATSPTGREPSVLGSPTPLSPTPSGHTLLGRLGSKLGRSMKRSSLVYPTAEGLEVREVREA